MHAHVDTATLAVTTKTDEPKYVVRVAVEADIPSLVTLGRALHEENGMMPFSERRAYEMAWRGVHKQGCVLGVIGPVGRPEAVICMIWGQFWYTDFPHLEELFAYVKPEFRRSTRAKALIEFAKNCSQELKAPLLIGILSKNQTEAKRRLYERQLGKASGYYFLFNGKTGA